MYRRGDHGLAKDHKKAAQLYGWAVDCGHVESMTWVATAFMEGFGVRPNLMHALRLSLIHISGPTRPY